MKYYLFLTTLIRNIGGGHIYTLNKTKYLQRLGYDVGFFHADVRHGEIIIKDLLPYEYNCDNHLQYPTYFFRRKTQEQVISSICNLIPKTCNEIIIESQTLICSTWGELLAKRLNAKHIIYLLSENHYIRNRSLYFFFRFKLARRELTGIVKKSLPILFKGWQTITEKESYSLTARSANVLADIPYPEIQSIPQSDYTIGSIGRIDKLFLIESLKKIVDFIKLHPEKTFTILLIGDSSEKSTKNSIKKIFDGLSNVKIFITGLIYPIPVELVLMPDVFISAAGACHVSNSLGKVTISIDANDFKPIGIIGKTTNNTLFRGNEPEVSLHELLEAILIKKEYKSEIVEWNQINYDYTDHLDFVRQSDNSKQYFDISTAKLSLRDWIEKICLLIFGRTLYPKIMRILSPLWMKFKKVDTNPAIGK